MAQNPAQLSAAATTMAARTKIMRAVYGGTETMRAEATFLPQYDKETSARYNARVANATALNKLRDAVDSASAKPFRTKLQVANTTPDLDAMINDVDLMGNHMHIFAHRLFNEALLVGQAHILVGMPTTAGMKNRAVQQASKVRPYFKMVKDDDMCAAYTENVGGDVQTTHVRIKGSRIARDEDFKETIINQVWVIQKEPTDAVGVVQLWESAASGGDWKLISEDPMTCPEVPFRTLHCGDVEGDFITRPVFLDLAYKQIEHFQSTSDQRAILTVSRFPMLAVSGVEIDSDTDENGEDSLGAIGPNKVLVTPDANGKWYYVEARGYAIEAGRKDLEALEMHMDMMALNPVVETHRQYVPQNERDIQETRVHSVIHDMAMSCKDVLEIGVGFMGAWTGKDYSEVIVELDANFDNTSDKMAEINTLLSTYEKKGISRETFLREAFSRNLFGDDFDLQKELQAMAAVDELAQTALNSNGSTSAKAFAAEPVSNSGFPATQDKPNKEF